jgi:hypothetical protein
MGLIPFWTPKSGSALNIHEYHSLSTGRCPKVKNILKKNLNIKPNGRIFLNKTVHQEMGFQDDLPYIYRDMGVDQNFFQTPSVNPSFDIVYCGSISGRHGLINTIIRLSSNFKVVVIGHISNEDKIKLNSKNITLLGPMSRHQIPEVYKESRYGLNYTPDIYPYNVQTSTKTLEYLASGLGVISNRYKWAERFFDKINYHPFWLDNEVELDINKFDDLTSCDYSVMQDYSWNRILSHSKFEGFLREVVNENN